MLEGSLAIQAHGVGKRFGSVVALDGFGVDVPTGHIFTLLGPSGSGKTTALRVVAGFERADAGTVRIRRTVVAGRGRWVPPEQRRVGMVFQDYALFPHLTVARNVAYGLPRGRQRSARAREVLDLVGLAGFEDRLPHDLSGGEQQRVALARALAPRPEVILLDEPFSNLDASLRARVRRELRDILRRSETTAVFVTHDQEEALAMSDVVAVMRRGRVVQASGPAELYRRPADAWVAGFLGDADFVTGRARAGRVETPVGTFDTDLDGEVVVMIRPEAVAIAADLDGPAVVSGREFFGHDQLVTVSFPEGTSLRARLGPGFDLGPGEPVSVAVGQAVTFAPGR